MTSADESSEDRFVQCCRASSEWRALDPSLGRLERKLASGHAQKEDVTAVLAEARIKVLEPAILAALEIHAWAAKQGIAEPESAHTTNSPAKLQAGYQAAASMWEAGPWLQANKWARGEDDMPPTLATIQQLRSTLRSVVGNVEDGFVETFPSAREALPGDEGARFRAQAVTVDLSGADAPGAASQDVHGAVAAGRRSHGELLLGLLTGKIGKREWARATLAGLIQDVFAPSARTPLLAEAHAAAPSARIPQLAVAMGPSAAAASKQDGDGSTRPSAAPPPVDSDGSGPIAAEGGGGDQGGGEGMGKVMVPSEEELIRDELPGLVVGVRSDEMQAFDVSEVSEARAAIAAIRKGDQPVVLRKVEGV